MKPSFPETVSLLITVARRGSDVGGLLPLCPAWRTSGLLLCGTRYASRHLTSSWGCEDPTCIKKPAERSVHKYFWSPRWNRIGCQKLLCFEVNLYIHLAALWIRNNSPQRFPVCGKTGMSANPYHDDWFRQWLSKKWTGALCWAKRQLMSSTRRASFESHRVNSRMNVSLKIPVLLAPLWARKMQRNIPVPRMSSLGFSGGWIYTMFLEV